MPSWSLCFCCQLLQSTPPRPLCQPRRKLALRSLHSSVYWSDFCICLISSWASPVRAESVSNSFLSSQPAPNSALKCLMNEGRRFYPFFLSHCVPLFCSSNCSLFLVWIFHNHPPPLRSPEDPFQRSPIMTWLISNPRWLLISLRVKAKVLTLLRGPNVAAISSLSINLSTFSLAHSVPPTTDPLQFPESTSLHGCLSIFAPPVPSA